MSVYDTIIVGAGAAGMTAAIFAANEKHLSDRILLLERTDKPGKKILMSGGTRCNVLPVSMSLNDYFTDSSQNLLKRIFKSWSVEECKNWFTDDLHLPLECEIETNKWFPVTNSAKDVRDALLKKVTLLNIDVRYDAQVTSLRKDDEFWNLETVSGKHFRCSNVIWATGGLSVPTIGTDGAGHQVLRALEIPLKPTYPALTPLTGTHPGEDNLSGVSLTVGLKTDTLSANREGFLFTHKGFSGPAVLDVSHCVTRFVMGQVPKPDVKVNWTGEDTLTWHQRLSKGKSTVMSVLKEHMPNRLAEALLAGKPYSQSNVSELSKKDRNEVLLSLTEYPLSWSSHEGYRKAEVTGGGVPLEAIHTGSMEVKGYPGLFVCGEIMDVFGRIGGFNFYWAWVTGRLAGKAAAKLREQQRAQEA
jgi:predicted Rossmann fold flavoprotein